MSEQNITSAHPSEENDSRQPSQRRRGGKRAQRAARQEHRGELLSAVLSLLDATKGELADGYGEDGLWGLSPRGEELLDEAYAKLRSLRRDDTVEQRVSDAACRALRRLDDFSSESDGWGYVTETCEGWLDEARETLRDAL